MAKFFSCLLLLSSITVLQASVLDASWSNSISLSRDDIDSLRPFAVFYEDLSLDGRNLGGSNFSASTHLNYTNRFSGTDRKPVELTHLYLDWQSDSSRLFFRAGRQGFFESLRPLFLDGLCARSRINRNVSLTAMAGFRVPSSFSSALIDARPDSSSLNLIVRADSRLGERTSLDVIYHQALGNESFVKQNIGLDLNRIFLDNLRAIAGFHYNIPDKKPEDFLVSANWDITTASNVNASFTRVVEHLDTASYHDTLSFETHSAADLSASIELFRQIRLSANYTGRFFSESRLQTQVSGRAAWKVLSLEHRQDFGDLGSGNKTGAFVHFPMNRKTAFGASGNYMAYRYPVLDASPRHAWSATAYTEASPLKNFDYRLEYQIQGNRYFNRDSRLYLNTRLHFTTFRK